MPDDPAAPQPTPSHYQRTTGGHLRWQPPSPEHLQEMLPAYEILSILGQGGMGAVYKGRQKSLDRVVAIKLLPPEAADSDMQFVERFKNEARTMAKMNHPAIVHVYDFGETSDGQLFIVMEFIDGTDVAKMIKSQGKLSGEYALSITAHVCDALQYAHTHNVIHRDIKPANILINMDGQVKVADFGLAKAVDGAQMGLTKTNMAMGTPDFVAPETLTPGMPIDGRADLYAVGVMLYNMLTGVVPRGAFRMPSVTVDADVRFDKIIGKAMEMDREQRYQTALDLRRDLDVILTTPAAKTGMQTIPAQQVMAQQSLPQKPVGKSPSAPQQQRPAGSAGMPAGSAKPLQGAANPATGNVAPAPAPKSNAGMIYGIAAVITVIAVAIFLFSGGGKKPVPAPKAVAEAKPEAKKPETKPTTPKTAAPAASTPLSGTFTLDVKDAELSGGEASFKREAFKDHHLVKGWFPGSNGAKQSVLTWKDVRVAAGKYDITFIAGGSELREFDMQLNVGKGRLSVLKFRPENGSVNATQDFPVGSLDLSSTAEGVNLVCTKWSLAKSGMSKLFHLRSIRFAPAASSTSMASSRSQPADILTFGGHRYQLVLEKHGYDGAKAQAEAMGGHLATITSKAEKEWVQKNVVVPTGIDGHIFLGGTKPKSTGIWTWVTGEPVDLNLWGGKGPDGSGTVLTLQSGGKQWDDVTTSSAYAFLVEWDDAGSTKPSAAPAVTGPVNLLALVDVTRDAVRGTWTLKPEGLLAQPQKNPAQLLGFNQTAPEEYDFEIEFTVKNGDASVIQVLPVSGGSIVWRTPRNNLSHQVFYFGGMLDGKEPFDPTRTEALVMRPALKNGQRYRSLIEVRKGSLRALLDGEEIVKWSGDFKRFTIDDKFALPDPTHLGIACFNTAMTFHKAELRPVAAGRAAAPQPPSGSGAVVGDSAPPKTAMPAVTPAPPPPADPRLVQLETGFKARYDTDAQKPFLAAVTTLNQSYVANGIARARTAAQAKNDLTAITALDTEKTAIEKGGGVPAEDAADTPDSLKTLRSTYRTALAKLAADRTAKAAPLYDLYLKALDAYVAELTKANKIDEATKVQTLREEIARQR